MDSDDIIEALEATALSRRDRGNIGQPRVADQQDCLLWKKRLLLFMESLDGDVTVDDIRTALENYNG
jgi:hypothetical protein